MYWTRKTESVEDPSDDVGLLHDEKNQEETPSLARREKQPWKRSSVWVAYVSGLLTGLLLVALVSLVSRYAKNTYHRVDRFPVARKDVFFEQDFRFVNDEVFTTPDGLAAALKEWVSLSTTDRGVVKIPPEQTKDIPGPVHFSRDGRGPQAVYFMSGFHQLHCLSSIMQSYSKIRQNLTNGHDRHGNGVGHITHCFDYLRQSIMCAGDSTLEGRTYDGDREIPIGWGSYHECRDWSQLQAWAEDRQPWIDPPYPDFL